LPKTPIIDARPEPTHRHSAAGDGGMYGLVAQLSHEVIRCPATFTGLLAQRPHEVGADSWARLRSHRTVLHKWQAKSLELLAASISGEAPPAVAASLLDHLPDHLGWRHHRSFPLDHVRPPQFFRTDETTEGKLLEVQCPGSLWGVHEILRDAYAVTASETSRRIPVLSAAFSGQLRALLGTRPVVHHLLDNSSHPAGERYFIHRARSDVSYFGYDSGVRPQDCNFVRAHDFPTLLNENFAAERLRQTDEGVQLYDLPPVALFDQKLLVGLPFWETTRRYYDDEVRALFPYTTVVTRQGIRLESGELLDVERFSRLSRRERGYYLKYAGSDVSRNWGSRAVYHLGKLSQEGCGAILAHVLEGFEAGERWIVQKEQATSSELPYLTRDGGSAAGRGHAKLSTFYGPAGPLGVLLMVESFYKVHGSTDTVTAVGALPPADADEGGQHDQDRC
jgi:hypothetical protein